MSNQIGTGLVARNALGLKLGFEMFVNAGQGDAWYTTFVPPFKCKQAQPEVTLGHESTGICQHFWPFLETLYPKGILTNHQSANTRGVVHLSKAGHTIIFIQ